MRPSFVSLQKLQQQKQLEHLKWNEHFQGSTVEQSLEKKIHTRWSFFCRLFCNFDSIRCVAITVLFLKAKVEKKITQCNNVLVIRGKFVKKNSMTVTSSVLWINWISNLIQSFFKKYCIEEVLLDKWVIFKWVWWLVFNFFMTCSQKEWLNGAHQQSKQSVVIGFYFVNLSYFEAIA